MVQTTTKVVPTSITLMHHAFWISAIWTVRLLGTHLLQGFLVGEIGNDGLGAATVGMDHVALLRVAGQVVLGDLAEGIAEQSVVEVVDDVVNLGFV